MTELVFKTRLDDAPAPKNDKIEGCWEYAKRVATEAINKSIKQWDEKEGAKDPLDYDGVCWYPKTLNKGKTAVDKYELKIKMGVPLVVLYHTPGVDGGAPTPRKRRTVWADEVRDNLLMMKEAIDSVNSKDDSKFAMALWQASYDNARPNGKDADGKRADVGSKRQLKKKPQQTLFFEDDKWEWR
tara:strand:+ start:628 stop:1182 length:555 start_codon:yes stop_codon:yes gene_type:complete